MQVYSYFFQQVFTELLVVSGSTRPGDTTVDRAAQKEEASFLKSPCTWHPDFEK